MRRWHRCKRWIDQGIPCPWWGVEEDEDEDQPEPEAVPSGQKRQASAANKAQAKQAQGSLHAKIEEPISRMEREGQAVSKEKIAVEAPASPPFIGAGVGPLWTDAPARAVAKAWTTPRREQTPADVIYADPRGPGRMSPFPVLAVRTVRSAQKKPTTLPIEADEQRTPPQRVGVPARSPSTGTYPLIERAIALAERGETQVPRAIAIRRTAPITAEQDAWNIQSGVLAIAGAVAIASLSMSHGTSVAQAMEKEVVKAVRQGRTTVATKTYVAGRGGGNKGGRAGGSMKGGAFKSESIWFPRGTKAPGAKSVVEGWKDTFAELLR